MPAPAYRPNCIVRVNVPNLGTPSERVSQEDADDVFTIDVRVFSIRLIYNNHNDADECEIVGEIDDIGLDPRLLKSCEGYVYLGDEDSNGDFVADNATLRFIGIAVSVKRATSDDDGRNVAIVFHDYTTLFLNTKKYPPSAVPQFSDTLVDAWNRICDHTGYFDLDASGSTGTIQSTVQRLKSDGTGGSTDRLVFQPAELRSVTLGSSVSDRLARLGRLEVQSGADAWAVWQTAVGSLGLISFIRGDRCVVTTATDFYTGNDPPRFVLGQNVTGGEEERNVQSLSTKNVAVYSFDPLTHQTVEAYWPPREFVKKNKKLAASVKGAGGRVQANDYDIMDCPLGITDPEALTNFARRVWEERVRQELGGEIRVVDMQVRTFSGAEFDVLSLQAGDRIRVEIEPEGLTTIRELGTIAQRQQALMARGYGEQPALFLAKNLDGLPRLTPEFQVHQVEVEFDVQQEDAIKFDIKIRYVNRIEVSGSAQPGDGDAVPAISNQKKSVAR